MCNSKADNRRTFSHQAEKCCYRLLTLMGFIFHSGRQNKLQTAFFRSTKAYRDQAVPGSKTDNLA